MPREKFARFCTVLLYSNDVIVPKFDTNFNLILSQPNATVRQSEAPVMTRLHVSSILGQRVHAHSFVSTRLGVVHHLLYFPISHTLRISSNMDDSAPSGSSRKRKRPRTEPGPTPGPSSTKKSRPATVHRPQKPRKPSDWHMKKVEVPDKSEKTKVHTEYI